jgi:hypothetical protein
LWMLMFSNSRSDGPAVFTKRQNAFQLTEDTPEKYRRDRTRGRVGP